jgi:hypothetical protein
MRVFSFRVVLAAVALAILAVPCVRAASDIVYVNVPFPFLLGERTMPAGSYRVDFDPMIRRVVIQHVEGRTFVQSLAVNVSRPLNGKGMLVFHKYGGTHVLRQVQQAGRAQTYQLPQSKAERELARNMAGDGVLLAGN